MAMILKYCLVTMNIFQQRYPCQLLQDIGFNSFINQTCKASTAFRQYFVRQAQNHQRFSSEILLKVCHDRHLWGAIGTKVEKKFTECA